ncbi:MAG: CoA transferase, partial [Desulfobacterales bacterium]|nr:CoA transferase [Desulfobacterales bacterium]
ADGRYISIGAVEFRFWKAFCDVLEKPEYAALQYDDGKRKEIIDFVREAFMGKPLAQWEKDLGERAICWGRVNTLTDVLEAPLFREREMVVDLADREGKTTPTIGVPVKLSHTPGGVRTPPVTFGESTAAILEELGYTEERIREFTEQGVV